MRTQKIKYLSYLSLEESRKFIRSLNFSCFGDWERYRKSGQKPENIPDYPHSVRIYKEQGWINYRDWLGIEFLSFKESKKEVQKLGIKCFRDWKELRKSGKIPKNIPSCPEVKYKKDWKGYQDWLGYVHQYKCLSFKKARSFVRKLKLKSGPEWRKYRASESFPDFLPSSPDEYYKDWTDWYDFLGKSREQRKYRVNDRYFKKWSADMAYILGFWFADGCITNGACFYISQHKKDLYLLEKISKKMKSNYPIRRAKGSNCFEFSVRSKTIYDDIIRRGGCERKSLKIKFPKVPDKYLFDFIRGVFDGDGCISRDNHKCSCYFCGGSKEFMHTLQKKIEEKIVGIKSKMYTHHTKKGKITILGKESEIKKDGICYYLHYSSINAKMLREYLYNTDSDLKLIRKWKEFVLAGKIHRPIQYLPFEEAVKFVSCKNFKFSHQYQKFMKGRDKKELYRIPFNPDVVYKKEWCGWAYYLGHSKIGRKWKIISECA